MASAPLLRFDLKSCCCRLIKSLLCSRLNSLLESGFVKPFVVRPAPMSDLQYRTCQHSGEKVFAEQSLSADLSRQHLPDSGIPGPAVGEWEQLQRG